MPTEVTTLASLASEAYACFETGTRPDGETTFHRIRDGSPEWLSGLTWQAHDNGEMLPDDWRYSAIVAALGFHSDDDGTPSDEQGHEFADGHVDAYNGARLAWLASHGARSGYVDQAREDGLAGENADLLEQIGAGQYVESLEVFEQVRGFLQDRLDELEDEED
jgi:hypothetical protein